MPTASCEEKTRLTVEYHETIQLYSAAVNELARKTGVVLKEEYDRLSVAAEKARQVSTDARARLERHIAKHGC